MPIVPILRTVLEKYEIAPDEPIVVGVSGWVDSMTLLHGLSKIHDLTAIHVVHVNHGLRGAESDGDEAFVGEFCEKKGISFHACKVDLIREAKRRKTGLEEAGRIVRQGAFDDTRKRIRARFVLLAHHLDDHVETVLFNFFRGTKLRGLSGIQERSDTILRPFLAIRKSDIRAYASQNDVPYREDRSNASNEFLRNRIRNNVIPEIEAINPNFRENLSAFAEYAKLVHATHESEIKHFLERKEFEEEAFVRLSELAQYSLLEALYRLANGTSVGLSEGNLAELRKFVTTANWGTKKELGKLLLTKKNRIISWASSDRSGKQP